MSGLGALANQIETAIALGKVADDEPVTWETLLEIIDTAISGGAE